MFLNKLRKYIESDECLIRHGRCVVIDGAEDQFDLLEDDAKVDEDKPPTISLPNNPKGEIDIKSPAKDTLETPNEVKEKTVAVEGTDVPETGKEFNPPEECSGKPKNKDYEKKIDAEPTGDKYEQTPEDEASKQNCRKGGTQYDMPDIENEKIRDVMEKIRIFEEKVDKVRKMKFIKK